MLLSLAMLFTLAPTAFAAGNESNESQSTAMNGTCGAVGSENKVQWALTDDDGDGSYTLTISGSGAMANLNKSTETENISDAAGTYPWAHLKDRITNIVIEDGVTSIGSKAFIAYTKVTSVSIGKDVSEIGVGALSQLSACTKFDVSPENSNFTTDTTGALFDHSKTKLIAFPCGCSSVEEYEIPATVKVISYGAFSRAAHLKKITIPADSSLSTIGYGAFAFTTALETVNAIPASAATIGDIPFAQSGVKHIYCADKDTKGRIQNKVNGLLVDVLLPDEKPAIEFTTDTGYTYRIDDGKALLVSAPKNVATSTVPSEVTCQGAIYHVTGIWKGAFAISLDWTEANSSKDNRNEVITSVDLPASVTQIGERAFYFCKNLTTITVKSTEVSIDYLAFATQNPSTSGTTVDFSAVTTLQSNGTAKWAGVKKVILNNKDQLDTIKSNVNPNTVAVIGKSGWVMGSDGNWAEQPKTNLTATVDGIDWTFDAVGGKATLTAYSSKEAPSVTVPSTLIADGVTYTVTELGKGLFGWYGDWKDTNHYNTSIKSVVIPKTVTTIGEDMFRYSRNLESVKIQGESITFKSARTFSNTNSLKVLDMSAVKSIAFGTNVDTYFSNMGSNNSSAVIYVSSSDIMSAVQKHRSTTSPCYLTYAVTNGGTFTDNTTFEANKLPTPVKAGYTFVGWYTDAACTKGELPKDDKGIYTATVSKNGTVYYAKWQLANNFVAITYNSNMAGESSKVIATAKNGTAFASANLFTRAGYSFNGWNTETNGKGTAYNAGASIPTSANLTLYAQWTLDKPTISGTTTAVYGNEVTLTANTAATGASYQWYKDGKEVANATDKSLTLSNVADSGAYTVKITVGTDTATSEPTTVTITKATPAISISADQTSLTGSGTVKLTIGSNGVPENGTVTVACDNGITVNNNDGTFTATLPNETKTYTFTASYAGDDNHNKATATCKVSVTHRSSGSSSGSSTTTSNSVSASPASNGKVSLDKSTAKKGDTVMVTVTPDAGYQLDKLTVTDKNGNVLKLTDKGDGKYSFTMPDGKVEVKAVFAKEVKTSPFGDVSTDAYYYKAVQWAQKKGITDGISSNLFGPKQPCTRGQIVTFLWRAAGSPEPKGTAAGMTDVVPGSYYAKAVAWAVENGITTGTAEGTFSPDATCTRAQAVTFLARAQNAKATGKTAFSDVPADSYFADAVAWAQANGVTTGTSETTFSPDNDCTRAQIVTFLYRANQGT